MENLKVYICFVDLYTMGEHEIFNLHVCFDYNEAENKLKQYIKNFSDDYSSICSTCVQCWLNGELVKQTEIDC